MKKIISRLIVFTVITVLTTPGCANFSNATVKVRVVDERGQPIQGVRSKVMSLSMDDSNSKVGFTDTNGMYSVHLNKIFAEIGGFFEKSNYYKTSGDFWQWDKWGGVPPANTNFIIVMKRIIEPVAMIKKDVSLIIPRLGEPVGFDLEVGDWVFPDGKGKIADILFTQEGYFTSEKDYSFTLQAEFTTPEGGLQSFHIPSPYDSPSQLLRSELPPPQIAPESGYKKTFERFVRQKPTQRQGETPYQATRRWIYRIRTVLDEEGKIVSANYGWTTDDIRFGINADGTCRIVLNYYYNPAPQSRSLEPKEIANKQAKDLPKGGD